jgi:hypothetical protein
MRLASTIEAQVRAVLRPFSVAIAIASWLTISNHCVFAAIASKPQPIQSECPFHSKPTKPQQTPAGAECCKTLRAITTSDAKIIPLALVKLAAFELTLPSSALSAAPRVTFGPETVDTGPPGRTIFAELIGSVQAHAPPVRA